MSTEQWQLHAKNLRAIKIEREEPEILVGQSLVLVEVQAETPLQKKKNPMNDQIIWKQFFQQVESLSPEIEWVNSVRKQDLCVLLKWDNISWPRTLVFLDNFAQWLVANTLYHKRQLLNRKDGFKEIWGLDVYWKSRRVCATLQVWNWNSNWVRESRQFLFLGQTFLWNGQICGRFYSRQQKFLQIHKKSKLHKQAWVWLQPGQRQKQNLNREYSLGRQQPFQYSAGQNVYLPVFCFEGLISEFPKFTYRFPSLRASFSSQVKKNRKPD